MRTVKHKIKPFNISENSEQEIEFLALARAYQFEKNYWSDQLLNLLNALMNQLILISAIIKLEIT